MKEPYGFGKPFLYIIVKDIATSEALYTPKYNAFTPAATTAADLQKVMS